MTNPLAYLLHGQSGRLMVFALIAFGLSATFVSQTEAKAFPSITGGGTTENSNYGEEGSPLLLSIGGFNAHATGPAVEGVYPAKGQIQAKAVLPADLETTLGSIHGKVVCMANLGPSLVVGGGGDPVGDVWEIRFQVTKAKGEFSVPSGTYGSAFIQDNGDVDYSDENFGSPGSPDCGITDSFQLESLIEGNISVHD